MLSKFTFQKILSTKADVIADNKSRDRQERINKALLLLDEMYRV